MALMTSLRLRRWMRSNRASSSSCRADFNSARKQAAAIEQVHQQVDIAVGAYLILEHRPEHGKIDGSEAAQQRLDLGCLSH